MARKNIISRVVAFLFFSLLCSPALSQEESQLSPLFEPASELFIACTMASANCTQNIKVTNFIKKGAQVKEGTLFIDSCQIFGCSNCGVGDNRGVGFVIVPPPFTFPRPLRTPRPGNLDLNISKQKISRGESMNIKIQALKATGYTIYNAILVIKFHYYKEPSRTKFIHLRSSVFPPQ